MSALETSVGQNSEALKERHTVSRLSALLVAEAAARVVVAVGAALVGLRIRSDASCSNPEICDESGFPVIFAYALGAFVVWNLALAAVSLTYGLRASDVPRRAVLGLTCLASLRVMWAAGVAYGQQSRPVLVIPFVAAFILAAMWIWRWRVLPRP